MSNARCLTVLAIVALVVGLGAGSASASTAPLSGTGWHYNWGSLDTADGFWPGHISTGTHLVFNWGSGLIAGEHYTVKDYRENHDIYSSPGVPDGEYWDIEALAVVTDTLGTPSTADDMYRFLAIFSTNQTILSYTNNTPIGIGDLAINIGLTVAQEAELGIKTAGTAQGTAKTNVEFGWGLDVAANGDWNAATYQRDPRYLESNSDTGHVGGYRPSQVINTPSGPENAHEYGSNFDADEGTAPTETVTFDWHDLFDGVAAGEDMDGPLDSGDGHLDDDISYPKFYSTYAFEVSVLKSFITDDLGGLENIALATSCLNDGIVFRSPGGGPPVPEVPPSVLLALLPAIGLVMRRYRSK